jgi:hypothetical protein
MGIWVAPWQAHLTERTNWPRDYASPVRFPRPVLVACLLALAPGALPAAAQDVPPPAPPRMASGIADRDHGPGAFVRVACSATCDIHGKIKVTVNMRRYLRLSLRTVGRGKGHLDGAGSIDVLVGLTNAAIRAIRKRGGNQVPVTLTATAMDGEGRYSKLTRRVTIPL